MPIFFNINFICGYIILILAIGLWRQGIKFSDLGKKFENLPALVQYSLIPLLIFIGIQSTDSINAELTILQLPYILINGMNILIHEAGHAFCSPFGRTLNVFGGTLFQIGVPSFFAIRAYKNKFLHMLALSIFWVGMNLPSIGRYMADARARALPLLGGELGEHDWSYLLVKFNLIKYDVLLGKITFVLGILIMLSALAYYFWLCLKHKLRNS